MNALHERSIAGKVSIIAPTIGLTAADIQKTDLLLASVKLAVKRVSRCSAMKSTLYLDRRRERTRKSGDS
jgi:hypothetical protein